MRITQRALGLLAGAMRMSHGAMELLAMAVLPLSIAAACPLLQYRGRSYRTQDMSCRCNNANLQLQCPGWTSLACAPCIPVP